MRDSVIVPKCYILMAMGTCERMDKREIHTDWIRLGVSANLQEVGQSVTRVGRESIRINGIS